MRLGRVTSLSPLRTLLNGDTVDVPALPALAFAGAAVGSEVLAETIQGQRYIWRVWDGAVAPVVPSVVGGPATHAQAAGTVTLTVVPAAPTGALPARLPFRPSGPAT